MPNNKITYAMLILIENHDPGRYDNGNFIQQVGNGQPFVIYFESKKLAENAWREINSMHKTSFVNCCIFPVAEEKIA